MNDRCSVELLHQIKMHMAAGTDRFLALPFAPMLSWLYEDTQSVFFDEGGYSKDMVSFRDVCQTPEAQEYIQWRSDLFEGIANQWSVIFIPAGVTITQPIVIKASSAQLCVLQKITVIVGANASVTIVYDQDFSHDKEIVTTIDLVVDQDAQINVFTVTTGSSWSKYSIDVHMRQAGGSAYVRSIVALDSTQQCSIITQQHHYAAHTQSTITVKSVLSDESKLLYKGMIVIDEKAEHSHASQQNKNILWSANARCWSIPGLEVKTNEVKCAHGSATGPLDASQLWYLQSRGISRDTALRLLLDGFIADQMQEVPESYSDEIMIRIMNKIIGA